MMKNTAACNIYMMNKIADLNPDANVIVLPADHLILKENAFLEKVNQAFDFASKNDVLITWHYSYKTRYRLWLYTILGKARRFL
jgi:mannose-1-phosphate guanylyltransferase